MISKQEVWDLIEPVVRELGLELFDLDVPVGASGVLRVFLWRGPAQAAEATPATSNEAAGRPEQRGVGIEECAAVSKRLINMENVEEFLPGSCVLEVSSPGINRRLSRAEHFSGAVGERIRVVRRGIDRKGSEVVFGVLTAVEPEELVVRGEPQNAVVRIPRDSIREARVDFKFD